MHRLTYKLKIECERIIVQYSICQGLVTSCCQGEVILANHKHTVVICSTYIHFCYVGITITPVVATLCACAMMSIQALIPHLHHVTATMQYKTEVYCMDTVMAFCFEYHRARIKSNVVFLEAGSFILQKV